MREIKTRESCDESLKEKRERERGERSNRERGGLRQSDEVRGESE